MQDLEFMIEKGKFYIFQICIGKCNGIVVV